MGYDGTMPVGSGRDMRLDPLALPVRFTVADPSADGRVRQVELDAVRVRVRRAVRGMRMAMHLPLQAFEGVAIRPVPAVAGEERLEVSLRHRDPALSVPLCENLQAGEGVEAWRLWAEVLDVPLLVTGEHGPEAACASAKDQPFGAFLRRARRAALKARRPSILSRRRPGRLDGARVHRDEREIIAPD